MNEFQKNLRYQFKNIQLLEQALTHKSCGGVNNERMEFFGDSILNFVAAELLFDNFKNLPEGNLSRVRAALVRQESLFRIGEKIQITKLVKFVVSDWLTTQVESMVADAVEAVFAAIYLDGGFEIAKKVVKHHLITLLNEGNLQLDKDPKTFLQEFLQSKRFKLPIYTTLKKDFTLTNHFLVSCEIPELKIKTTGQAVTRKKAEMLAASKAIKLLPT